MKTNEQEITEGRHAERILNDPMFQYAFEGIESSLIDKMRKVPMADKDTQHELVLSLQLLNALRQSFSAIIQTGKMAEIQKEQSLAQKVMRFGRK